ncbi:unnamed protein product, partial [Larinioides sclopetarius]
MSFKPIMLKQGKACRWTFYRCVCVTAQSKKQSEKKGSNLKNPTKCDTLRSRHRIPDRGLLPPACPSGVNPGKKMQGILYSLL